MAAQCRVSWTPVSATFFHGISRADWARHHSRWRLRHALSSTVWRLRPRAMKTQQKCGFSRNSLERSRSLDARCGRRWRRSEEKHSRSFVPYATTSDASGAPLRLNLRKRWSRLNSKLWMFCSEPLLGALFVSKSAKNELWTLDSIELIYMYNIMTVRLHNGH